MGVNDYTPLTRLDNIESYMEAEADKLQKMISIKCQQAIIAQLIEWKKRFPRHDFHAWEGHGLLCFEVSPPILGEDDPADLATRGRGAITELGKEAQAFIDKWHGIEYRLTTSPVTGIIRIPT